MDIASVCRTCLSDQNLNPIFFDLKNHERYSMAIYQTAGVKVSINDGLPQNICKICVSHLNNCLKFRKKCREVEAQLLNVKLNNQDENIEETSENNRQSRGLSIDNIDFESIEVKTEDEEYLDDLDQNKLFISECPSPADSGSEDEKPLKYLVESGGRETGVVETDATTQPKDTDSSVSVKRVSCDICNKMLSIRSIKAHLARCHPGVDDSKEKCDLCDSYILKKKMERHKLQVHQAATDKVLRCGYCKSEFDEKPVLLDHVKSCTAKKKRKGSESGRQLSECDVCHKRMQRASLKMHKAVKHAGLGPVCEHCGRRFGNKLRLTEHYRAKHGYDKLRCSYCDFHTASVMSLKNHERRHRGEKPFVCETCGAKFHAAYLLSQHKQSHRTQKLIKCDLCPASFKANNSLHIHRSTCHSTALYKCTICSRAYSCRLYAIKHIRHVHQYKGPVPALQRVDNTD